MADVKALLVNLAPDEVNHVRGVLSQFDLDVDVVAVPTVEDAELRVSQGGILLVVLHVDERLARPDQGVRRIKRSLPQPVPILLLIPPELAGKVRDYFRAGADEYWILPMDAGAFPPRLYVLLEWGRSVLDKAGAEPLKRGWRETSKRSFLQRAWHAVWRAVRLGPRPAGVESHEVASGSVGKWERIRSLGFGSFGEAWLVRERGKDRLAVTKIPHSPKMNTKFLREAAILKRLEGQQNAVQFIEVEKDSGKVILIQEYVEGATLQELIDQGMDSATKERAFRELLEIVAYAHDHKIMHRDIKPENIIINTDGVLKLLDFGTGKDMSRRSISNTVIGSRPYMAPEQIMGKSRLASDVWALGVILYALSTGFLPFYDENEKQLMDMILEVEPETPRNLEPDLPEEMEAVILKCLQKDWEKRYRTASELKRDLGMHFPDFGKGKVLPA
jgi:predicted Ser/Thr protein kinase